MSKIIFPDYNQINHAKVGVLFEGNPEYIADFCVLDQEMPSSVYFCKNPNRDKNHKDYMTLTFLNGKIYVSGFDKDVMEKYRKQFAIKCRKCESIIYSLHRHDMRYCACKAVAIDGGRIYTKISGADTDCITGAIDFIDKIFIENEFAGES